MKRREKGFTLIELAIATSIMALSSIAAGMAIFQVMGGTANSNDRMTAVHQVQNAGYWINHDAQMALSINGTVQESFPGFLEIGWTEWDNTGSPVYHTVEYTLESGSDNVYSLKRSHTSTDGVNEQMIVANYIYYEPGSDYSSDASYTNPVLSLNLTSMFHNFRETREYMIKRRAGL